MTPYLQTDRATLYHARAEEVYPHLAPGSVSMVWSDGPYAMKKAAWDMMGVDGLADWYAPHVEAWGRVCAPSATVYLWNTAAGWARLDPVMRTAGWAFRTLIVWNKGGTPAMLAASEWPMVFEVCAVYTRGSPPNPVIRGLTAIWSLSHTEYSDERIRGDKTLRSVKDGYEWQAPAHPCQKPLAFASRAVLASTRIGDTILDPFAGTNRVALACRRLPEEERRHAIGIEMEARWLEAVRPSLVVDHRHTGNARQPSLFNL